MSSEVILEAKGLWKVYETPSTKVEALRDVDIRVKRGELVAVMGPSGCGKTTLLNCLSGLDEISAGEVEVEGIPLSTLPDKQLTALRAEKVGFIFQALNLLPVLTARENVEVALQLQPNPPPDSRERALSSLEKVGLRDWAAHRPAELSGGQQQRVTIARAFAHEPILIFGDELTGMLDRKTSDEVMTLLRNLNRVEGVTMVVVTHDPSIAATCTRIVKMEDGRIVSDIINSEEE